MSAPLADASARAEALDLSRHVLTVAPAGSGKTGLLVQRLLAALAAVETPEQVVAMTFTNKAAAEIRARTLELLHRAAAGEAPGNPHEALSLDLAHAALARDRARDWQLIVNPERLRATTIDGLQAQIAAELPLLSGLGGRPRVVEDARALYEEAVLALFDEIEDASAPAGLQAAAASWLRAAGNRVDRLMAPLCALLARREQWSAAADPAFDWAAQEDAVLAALHETHQRRLAQALGEHDAAELAALAREGAAESEALAWAAQLERWPQTGAEHAALHAGLATLLVTKDGSLRKANGINARLGFPPRRAATLRLKALLAAREGDEALALAAAELIALPPPRMPADLAQLRDALLVLLRRLLAQLHVAMGERGEVDFVEIGQAALRALRPDGGYGEALLKRDAQLRHLLVDEMQDTSEGQLRLLEQLTAGWQPGDGRSLFLVGDPQQSIYAFRKAEVRLFQRLWREGRLGELALQRVRLSSNFRSSAEVVDWFNRAFAAIFPARDDELAGEVAFSASVAARPPASDGLPAVSLHAYAADDSAAEARAAAQRAAGLSASGASVAILVRARPHVRQTLRELRALGVRAACQDVDPLAAVPAVRDVLALARALWHPEDRLSWAVLLRAPFVGLSWADLLALSLGRRREPWPQRLAASEAAPLSDEGRTRVARLRAALEQVQHDAERPSLAERVETLWTALGGAACCDAGAP
jgi:ATP-dependent exoDNAse (exonuclease V) beta subunit